MNRVKLLLRAFLLPSVVTTALLLCSGWTHSTLADDSVINTVKNTSQVHGYIENQEIIRSDTYVRDYNVASFRNRVDAQPSGTIANNINGGPLFKDGSIEYFAEIRAGYEGVYDAVPTRFGDGNVGFSGVGNSPFNLTQGSGADAAGVGLLRAFGYDLRRFKFVGARNFAFADPINPDALFIKPCSNCINVDVATENLRWERDDSNKDYYPLREAYFDVRWDFLGQNWLRLGKQQTVWGKADFFRLQDIVNPVDYAQHFFIEPFEDTRIPQLSANLQHRFGDVGIIRDLAATFVWNFDQFNPVGLGQSGQPWAVTFGDEKRAFAFNNGLFTAGLCPAGDMKCFQTVNFALDRERRPDWRVRNGGIGMKVDWEIPDPQIRFALTDYWGNRDTPTFALTKLNVATALPQCPKGIATIPAGAPSFTLANGLPISVVNSGSIVLKPGVRPDTFVDNCTFGAETQILYHKVNTLGLSADYFESRSGLVFRLESSWTHNALLNNTNSLDWTSNGDILAWVLGIDKQHFMKFLNPDRTFFSSAQVFETYYPGQSSTAGGKRGLVTGTNNFIFTAFTQTHYYRDQIIPLLFVAYGTEGTDATIGGDTEYLINDHWSARIGFDAFVGKENRHDVGPFAAFLPSPASPWSETVFGYAHEQAGGAQRNKDDEFWTRLRYRF